jgi:hypothetical protein
MRYEIRIDGSMPADTLREAFPELEPKVQAAHTVLSGPVVDEAQLYRLLVRFQELGLHVIEFCRLPD